MDFQTSSSFRLLIIFSLLCLQARAESTGSIFFLDSPTHRFLRTRSSDAVAQTDSMFLPEVGAAVSVLLGFAPPATLSAASSFKLNELLKPNPFNRPHAVFMLEVRGAEDSQLRVDPDNAMFSRAYRSNVILGSNKANIELPDLLESMGSPAELLTGCFDGIKALQEQYGSEGVAQQGVELFLTTISKIFDSLQAAYKGQIVGVLLFNGTPPPDSDSMLNVIFTSQSSSRQLEEKEGSPDMTIVRVALVRRTLAWITGIILLVSTLLGIYFLLNMPLTRDTLLYSNVKLD
ncbi:hypothetical protein L1049_016096 [Liquidambar formosana]|uniref:DUF7794 domain-containing protein n=1 Tax=Liquidambar formosana TaxID=63359 RepID=A0AAP0S535_LIQFO